MLASEYGWGFNEILETVYPDDLQPLLEKMNDRKLLENKMQLAIVQNPHVKDPRQLWKSLELMQGKKTRQETTKFDALGMERLKDVMKQNPRIVVKS